MRIGSGCVSIGLVILVLPIPLELSISALSNWVGPDLQDYCKKENLVKIYDAKLYEKRRQEVDDRNVIVSDGWTTVVTEKHVSRFMYNSIRIRTAMLFLNDQKVAHTRHYASSRENIFTLVGMVPASGTPCRVATDYHLENAVIVEAYNDPRFAPPEYR